MSDKKLELAQMEADIAFKEKEMIVSYLLWFFLGFLGVHRFYLGRIKTGVALLLMNTIGILLVFPLIIGGIWWLADAYFTFKYTEEHNLKMKKSKLEHLSAAAEEGSQEEILNTVKEEV